MVILHKGFKDLISASAGCSSRYFPFDFDQNNLAGQIKKYRYLHGVSQEYLANLLNINESTVSHFEKGTHRPMKSTFRKLQNLSII